MAITPFNTTQLKAIDFGTNRKLICDFLLVTNLPRYYGALHCKQSGHAVGIINFLQSLVRQKDQHCMKTETSFH